MVKVAMNRTAVRPVKRSASAAKTAPRRAGAKATRAVKRERPAVTEGLKPERNKLTQREVYEAISDMVFGGDENETEKLLRNPVKTVKTVLDALEELIISSVMPKGVGEFKVGKLIKIVTKHVPARKIPARPAGKYPNPFNGGALEFREAAPARTKPATVKVRGIAMRTLKDAVLGN